VCAVTQWRQDYLGVEVKGMSPKSGIANFERRLFLAANIQTWKYRQYECLESRPKHERSGRMGLRVEDPELSIEVGWLRLVELGR
jgi:hypothetical protein